MSFILRSEWGLTATWPDNRVAPSKRTGFAVHWDGGPMPDTESDEIRLMLAYHRYHLFTAKTGGFDYNLAVGPVTGNVYEGRGLDVVGAHAGGANTPNIGVILIGGPGNLTDAGKRGLREAYALACKHAGRKLVQLVHSDLNTTACPGSEIRGWVHGGGLNGGDAPITSPRLLDVDGVLGPKTITDWQEEIGTPADGTIDRPSPMVARVQELLNAAGARDWDGKRLIVDGIGIASNHRARVPAKGRYRTLWALQDYLGTTKDGYLTADGSECIEELQRRLNEGRF